MTPNSGNVFHQAPDTTRLRGISGCVPDGGPSGDVTIRARSVATVHKAQKKRKEASGLVDCQLWYLDFDLMEQGV